MDSDGAVYARFDSPDQDITLPLHTRTLFAENALEYGYMTEGYRKADWTYQNESYNTRGINVIDDTASLSGKKISWEFPDEISEINGSADIPEYKTLKDIFDPATGFFPYIELVSNDAGAITAINYRIVQSPDISKVYSPDVACMINLHINGKNGGYNFENSNWESETWDDNYVNSGTWYFDEPLQLEVVTSIWLGFRTYKIPRPDEADGYLSEAPYYQEPKNFVGYSWVFTDEAPLGEVTPMSGAEIDNMLKDMVADSVEGFNATDEIQVLDRREIFDESTTTEEVANYFSNQSEDIVGRFKQLYTNSEGWVVTKVTLTDELYDNLQGVSADNLKVYSLTEEDLQEQQQVEAANNSFFRLFSTPAFAAPTPAKTGKLVNLDGSKLDTINSKELLMVSYLKAGQKSNMYLGLNSSITTPTPANDENNETPDNPNSDSDSNNSNSNSDAKPVNENNDTDKNENKTVTIETASGTISNGNFTTKSGNNKSIAEIISELGANAATITGFVLNNNSITKLTSADIKALSSLESLDLSAASALTEIDFSGVSVKIIKVSSNTVIRTMNFEGSAIEDLDTNGCTNLTNLNLKDCKNLKTLNTQGCKNLMVLILSGCEQTLTTLNINKNSLLLIDLSKFGAQLKSLDLSGQSRNNVKVDKKINLQEFFNTSNDYTNNVTIAEAKNASGDVLEWKIASGEIEFTGIPYSFKYYFDTGFAKVESGFFASASSKDVSMDVSISSDGSTNDDDNDDDDLLGSSGGGCSLGFGIFVVSALGFLICKKD